jgi:hypothetical protein
VNCEKRPGRKRVTRGRSAEREAQISAVPTSITLQLSDPITWSVRLH